MSKEKRQKSQPGETIWKVIIALVIIALVGLLWLMNKPKPESKPQTPVSKSGAKQAPPTQDLPASESPGTDILIGQWLRPDGGYVMEITKINNDGTLEAGYFNPRPIHVAEAVTSKKDGNLTVFMKLQDQGYPGSTYTLNYDAKNDALIGTYFQAAYNQNYSVFFTRMKQ